MKLNELLKQSFNAADDELQDEMRLNNYRDSDSMSLMFFITKLEEIYEVEFSGDEIASMETVGKIKELIVSKGKTP